MKKKEQLELEAETTRLFDKAEKKHQDHLTYLYRQEQKAEREAQREARREECRVSNEKYKAERDKEKADTAEKLRIWNSYEARAEREQYNREEEKKDQKRIADYKRDHGHGGSNRSYYGSKSSSGSSRGYGFGGVYEPRTGGGPSNVEGN